LSSPELFGQSANPIPPAAAPQPSTAKTKNYFAPEQADLGTLLSELSALLNNKGLNAAHEGQRLGNQLPQAKQQLENVLQRIDATRTLTIELSRGIWDEIIYKNPRFQTELRQIVGDNNANSKLGQFQVALNTFHRDVSIFVERYDQLAENNRGWIAELLRRDTQSVYDTSNAFQGWVQDANQQIDEMRELLR
jgi:ElaB/YqjD/DUF883 family membrane-anchored ribosome-binding protein